MQATRRGWYPGKETFKDRLLKLTNRTTAKAPGGEIRDHGEKEAIQRASPDPFFDSLKSGCQRPLMKIFLV